MVPHFLSSQLRLCSSLWASVKPFATLRSMTCFGEFAMIFLVVFFDFPKAFFGAIRLHFFEFCEENSSITSQLAAAFGGLSRFSAENPGYYASQQPQSGLFGRSPSDNEAASRRVIPYAESHRFLLRAQPVPDSQRRSGW